ncbi:dipeptide/oligopeptide/nickel ABC transporter permease/ATP-binding protein [Fodinicola feengrottensis]|uniref:Dipeptide/oligopeptide/nickel ABC transporter permease/ATP-binding protein n=1 Tax=Fodinicola feengrottensis TaxID=435914 RepID=A0ABN2I609_9ACTN
MKSLLTFLLRSRKITVGVAIILFFVLLATIGPVMIGIDPSATGADSMQPPSAAHWLGTTQAGEDVLAQLLYGSRISLAVGLLAAVVATVVSSVVGLVGGYLRGIVDEVLSLVTSVFLVIPAMPLLIVLAGYLPSKGIESVAIIISITAWASGARSIRAQTLSIRNRDYIQAARASGETLPRIIFFEVLPNEIPLLASSFLFTILVGILAEAGLSFLGLGSLTTVSWGSMLFYAQQSQALLAGAWWWFLPPGLCIALIGTGLSLVNFGIDEYANPRLRTVRAAKVPVQQPPSPQMPSGPGFDTPPLLEIRHLSVDYLSADGPVHAVKDVSLTLHRGELLGLAGESGSGKSTLTGAVARLLGKSAQVTGGSAVYFRENDPEGADILKMGPAQLGSFRWNELSIVLQSSMNALNPVLTIGAQFDDVISRHRPGMAKKKRRELAGSLLESVGIPAHRLRGYPHELSGGMKQRTGIAMALALDPAIVILDEPTTALDVLVQRQILTLLLELRERYGFSVIFTTHDLSLLLEICDTIAIMRHGELVEYAAADDVHLRPKHEYTRELLDSLRALGVAV